MQIRCEYCGSLIDDALPECPNCGAPNSGAARTASGIPHTVPELQAFCAAHHLDPEKMHFHIGEDYSAPKAFGIYEDGEGNYVVYKNKADGSRFVRYRGKDEAYAVNEIYQKLKSEINLARERSVSRSVPIPNNGKTGSRLSDLLHRHVGCSVTLAIFLIFFLITGVSSLFQTSSPRTGYYDCGGETYYYEDDSWYFYGSDGWTDAPVYGWMEDGYNEYFTEDYDGEEFYDAGYDYDGDDYGSYDNDWSEDWDDDDWDWSSDYDFDYDWDSGSDWDSDW